MAVIANDSDDLKGTLRKSAARVLMTGTAFLPSRAVEAPWVQPSSPETRRKQLSAAVAALAGIGPKDPS